MSFTSGAAEWLAQLGETIRHSGFSRGEGRFSPSGSVQPFSLLNVPPSAGLVPFISALNNVALQQTGITAGDLLGVPITTAGRYLGHASIGVAAAGGFFGFWGVFDNLTSDVLWRLPIFLPPPVGFFSSDHLITFDVPEGRTGSAWRFGVESGSTDPVATVQFGAYVMPLTNEAGLDIAP